jgi:hypothetical protein
LGKSDASLPLQAPGDFSNGRPGIERYARLSGAMQLQRSAFAQEFVTFMDGLIAQTPVTPDTDALAWRRSAVAAEKRKR